MGGSLFELGRCPREDYLEIENELKEYFEKKFPPCDSQVRFRIPRYYDSKPDFGDVDILVASSALKDKNIFSEIANELGVTKYSRKGGLSMVYKDKIQVDVMSTDDKYLDTTWQFLCYNDLGNLLGKHYRRFNLKYGEKGLLYVYRRNNSSGYTKEILLSQNMEKILNFLELSFAEWDAGFKTLEDMFDWVISCKYFTAAPFINLTKNTAKRAKLRTTMKRFVQYVEDNNITKEYDYKPKDEYLPTIMEYFSDVPLADIIRDEKLKEEREDLIRSKFSGNIVMKLIPELSGRELGQFIANFKSQYADFDSSICEMTPEEIEKKILSFHNESKK